MAEKNELLRVPGIGIRGAEAILEFRIRSVLRDLGSLKKLGIVAERAAHTFSSTGTDHKFSFHCSVPRNLKIS